MNPRVLIILTLIFSCAHRGDVQSPEGLQPQVESVQSIREEEKDIADVLEEDIQVVTENLTGESKFDIPIIINEKVEYFINYFQTKHYEIFRKWLNRSEKYIPIMKKILVENSLPEDLVYLALIESGFSTHAYSRARASGPWQFIKSTGKRYGLKVNDWVDERRDPEKSTIAAARYLKDLYDIFGHWYLAAAAYNAGEGKVLRAMQRSRSSDFWDMANTRYLKRETKDYVPKMIAAALIAKDPSRYGFSDLEYSEPINYEKIKLDGAYDLKVISKYCDIPYSDLKELNPELMTDISPPYEKNYYLKVPAGRGRTCQSSLAEIPYNERYDFKIHIVRKGDTLGHIARRYRSTISLIMSTNRIRNERHLRVGARLIIPVLYKNTETGLHYNKKDDIIRTKYIVRRGDTLWGIAREYGISVNDLMRWNNLDGSPIRPGDVLIIK